MKNYINQQNNILVISIIGLLLFGNSCAEKKMSPKKLERIHGFAIQQRNSLRGGFLEPIKDTEIYLTLDTLANYVYQADTFKQMNHAFKKPFDSIQFNKAIAYDYLGEEEIYDSVLNGQFAFVPTITNQKILNWQQTQDFITLVTSNSTYGGANAACFNPHFGVVLYHNNKPVFTVDVCLNCNSLTGTKEIPAMFSHKVNTGTEHEYAKIGFSDKGKQAIRHLCKQLNFYYGRK